MKKTAAILLSLILLISGICPCFAENYEVDSFSNYVEGSAGSASNSGSSQQVRITSSCYYDRIEGYFIYKMSTLSEDYVECSVYDGEITTDSVRIIVGSSADVEVYLDGEPVDCSGDVELTQLGAYTVRDASSDTRLFNFTIVNTVTGVVDSYQVPSIYSITELDYNDTAVTAGSSIINLQNEGSYYIRYYNADLGIVRTLDLVIDHTAPELVLNGVENGSASTTVTFGDLEDGSSVLITRDGKEVAYGEGLDERGSYHVDYTDAAGNTSSYDFVIRLHLNVSAAAFLVSFAAIIGIVIGYMIHCRKHMRTF